MLSGRRWIGLLGAASLLALGSCDAGSPTTSAEEPEPAPVQGAVTGSVQVEGLGLESLQITLSGSVDRTSTTDSGGRFRFDGLSEGNYVVAVSGLPSDADFEVSDTSVSITRDRPTTAVDFAGTWKRDASIEVIVRVGGEGFEAATVALQGPDASFTTPSGSTDTTGAVVFEGLRRATWGVTLTGYDPLLHDFPTSTASVEATDAERRQVAFDGTEIPQIPTPPVALVATATGADAISLVWSDASDDEERFEIERRTPGDTWGPLDTVAMGDTTFIDGGLAPAVTWAYRVRACNVAGCSDPSNEAEATTDQVPPSPPLGLTAEASGPTGADISWTDASDNETRFELERRTAASGGGTSAGPWSAAATPSHDATTFSDTGLKPATAYQYRIRACNGAGCSAFSGVAGMTTDDVPPSSPSGPSVLVSGATTLRLTWTDTSGNEDTFEIERRQGGAGTWGGVGTEPENATRFDDTGLTPTTSYGYRVRACNEVGCSAWTAEVTGTTAELPPLAPTSLSATADGETAIDLAWVDASDNETGFEIQSRPAGGSWAALTSLPAGSSSYTDSSLTPGSTWHYRVRACNAGGCSDWSGTASATTDTPAPTGQNLSIGGVYIVQRIQRLAGDVPLVADLDGYLRVFVLAEEPNTLAPDVRVDFYLGGGLAHSETLTAPGGSVPLTVDEGSLGASWNVSVQGSLIQPGLEIEVVVDPADAIAESVESDNAYPDGGGLASLDVRDTPTFDVTFVPVRQTLNGQVGDVSAANAANFMEEARAMLPFADDDFEIRAEYSTDLPVVESGDGDSWGAVLSEINTLRQLDGSGRFYYGVLDVTYGSGIAGVGYVGWPVAIGWDKSGSAGSVAAHEWGHNLGRGHSPGCGANGADASYPHSGGGIGHWGLHVPSLALRSPSTYKDFMSYCGPEWISDYVFEKIIDGVAPAPASGTSPDVEAWMSASQPAEPGLLVWGRVQGGELILEPALEVNAPPSLPSGGDYTIEGRASGGSSLFSLEFDPIPMADGSGDEGHFAFVLPSRSFDWSALAELRLSSASAPIAALRRAVDGPALAPGAGRAEVNRVGASEAEVTWDPLAYPMVVVRDADTGQVLSLGRSGRVRVTPDSDRIELEFSNGLRTIDTRVQSWR